MNAVGMESERAVAVLFDADLDYATAVYQGVQEQMAARTGWAVLPLAPGHESALVALQAAGRLQGVIAPFVSDKWIGDRGLDRVPAVNIANLSDIRSVDGVVPDDREAGRLAATAFIDSGFRNFGFAGVSGIFHARLRREGFIEAVRAQGGQVSEAPMVAAGCGAGAWTSWLQALPRPAGIYGATDFHARLVVRACRELGLGVPDDVAVIGTGNATLQGLLAGMTLSSVELPGVTVGREAAAQLLARATGDGAGPRVRRLIRPVNVLHRDSSACCLGADPVVARAMAYIRPRLAAPLDVAGVARAMGVSRRLLEMRFRSVVRRGPYREILRLRMEHAARLLADTSMKVLEVGAACGLPEPHHFSAVFRRWHGCSPQAWRDNGPGRPARPAGASFLYTV